MASRNQPSAASNSRTDAAPAASFTDGPWYVLDQRATTLRAQGWPGEIHDAILISSYAPAEIRPDHCDCIVARITFSNRTEELGDSNMADARLIASSPTLYAALTDLIALISEVAPEYAESPVVAAAQAAIDNARAERVSG